MSNTGREVTKGIVDVTGDKKAGINTIAVIRGVEAAARVGAVFYIVSVVSSVLPVVVELVSFWYIPFVIITDIGLLHGAYSLVKKPTRENARAVKNKVLYLMFIALIGFAAGSL
jgi:geranylgeranylglycerol-phosphate geranylgeranyltransferase